MWLTENAVVKSTLFTGVYGRSFLWRKWLSLIAICHQISVQIGLTASGMIVDVLEYSRLWHSGETGKGHHGGRAKLDWRQALILLGIIVNTAKA